MGKASLPMTKKRSWLPLNKIDRRIGIPLLVLVALGLLLTAIFSGCQSSQATAFDPATLQEEALLRIGPVTDELRGLYGPNISEWPEAAQLYWLRLFNTAYPSEFSRRPAPGEAGP